MPVSGLVIVSTGDHAPPVHRHLGPAFTVGLAHGRRLPVVLETRTADESRRHIDRLRSLPGVAAVEVAYVDFADCLEPRGP